MAQALEGIRSMLILEENLKLIGTKYSFEDYRIFYDRNFTPVDVPEDLRIDDGTQIFGEDEFDEGAAEQEGEYEEESEEEEDFPFGL